MSNLDTNHYLISVILFLLIIIVFISTRQSLCSIREQFPRSEPLSIVNDESYDTSLNTENEFMKHSSVEPVVLSENEMKQIKQFNISGKKQVNEIENDKNLDDDNEYKKVDYLNNKDFSMKDGTVYALSEKEYIDPSLSKDNTLGIRQSNEDIEARPTSNIDEGIVPSNIADQDTEMPKLEPKAESEPEEDCDRYGDEFNKSNSTSNCGKKKEKDNGMYVSKSYDSYDNEDNQLFNPIANDPYNKYSHSDFDISYAQTQAYKPLNILENDDKDNLAHSDDIYTKQNCKIIKTAMKTIDKGGHFKKSAKEPWNKTFREPCGEW